MTYDANHMQPSDKFSLQIQSYEFGHGSCTSELQSESEFELGTQLGIHFYSSIQSTTHFQSHIQHQNKDIEKSNYSQLALSRRPFNGFQQKFHTISWPQISICLTFFISCTCLDEKHVEAITPPFFWPSGMSCKKMSGYSLRIICST